MVSDLIYNTIKNIDFSRISENRFKYSLFYNSRIISFILEFNSNTGEIEKIEPNR